jgi:iron complex transport system substrate-binding protein
MSSKKIVTLLAAGTEIVYALGLEDQLVGVSHECDYPDGVKELPVCSTAVDMDGASSKEIDATVKRNLSDALSIYNVDRDKIKDLQPDVIITQTQCEVCAVSLKDVEEALCGLLAKDAEIISLSPNTLADILNDIKAVAEKLVEPERGEKVLEELEERISLIRHKLKFIENRPKVACLEWIEPLMIAGNWTPELIEIAGGAPVLAKNGVHSPYINPEALLEANPDIIVVAACGFSIERTLQEVGLLMALPGWSELSAVKNNRFYVADGNHYFNRSGPRIVDTIEILAEIINPKQFVFGYEGKGWLKFEIN